jgi:hypothetical protein
LVCGGLLEFGATRADDWPMFGRDGSRNAVSSERGAPTWWSVEERDDGGAILGSGGIRWSAKLGTMTHGDPVVSNGLIWVGTNNFFNSEDKLDASVLACFRESDGKSVSFEELYRQPLRIDRFQDGTVLVGDHVYSYDERGLPICLAWNTGAAAWKQERSLGTGRATVIYADGCLYFRRVSGQMTLAKASPAGFTRLGEFMIPDHSQAPGATMPVIAGGRLYLRDDQRLHCYDVRANAAVGPQTVAKTIKLDVSKAAAPAAIGEASGETKIRTLRSVFVPTPQDVVDKMLEMAAVKKTDVVYDLGSGDGRIVITAAKKYGCKVVGYEIDKELVDSPDSYAATEISRGFRGHRE